MGKDNEIDRFAERVISRRDQLNISRTELGEKIGFNGIQGNKNVYKYESGTARPSYEVLVKLAKALNCSTDYLLGITDNPNVFTGNIDNRHYELEIEDCETDKPYHKDQFKKLILKLEEIGFDPKKLLGDEIDLNN